MKATKEESLDLARYAENRNRHPLSVEEQGKYAGQWVACNAEGTRIIASGKNLAKLQRRLRAQGIDPEAVVFELVPPPDEALFL